MTSNALSAQPMLYLSVGPQLMRCFVDAAAGTLSPLEEVAHFPANVQYAWPDSARRFLYVASSDGAPGFGIRGECHHLSALTIAPGTGALAPHGTPLVLPSRPIHMSVDPQDRHVLVAFSDPADLRVYAIDAEGRLLGEVEQAEPVDPGIFPHQVRVTTDGRLAVLLSRGHNAREGRPEVPGVMNVFAYDNGQLRHQHKVAPDGGYGFGPRHLDFHANGDWIYVLLERQHRLDLFTRDGDTVSEAPVFSAPTLPPGEPHRHPGPGPVRIHPSGRFVYVADRAPEILGDGHRPSYPGGGNFIVAYAIDPATGAPQMLHYIESGGVHCRTLQIDPSGTLLIAGHISGLTLEGDPPREVPGGLGLFRIGADGLLTRIGFREVDTRDHLMFWTGMITLNA